MSSIQASEFKAKCLALMDEVARSGQTMVVTKNGKPLVEVRPFSGGRVDSPIGLHRDVCITGDIVSPLDDAGWTVLE